jgi:hypothetical protein
MLGAGWRAAHRVSLPVVGDVPYLIESEYAPQGPLVWTEDEAPRH